MHLSYKVRSIYVHTLVSATWKAMITCAMHHLSLVSPADLVGHEEENIFDLIRRHDLFVHHPFETFKTVEDFVAQAANDPPGIGY